VKADFEVQGAEEVMKKLHNMAGAGKKILRKSMRKGAKVIQKEAKANAPVGSSKMLKKNIKVKAGKRSRETITLNVQNAAGDYKGQTYYAAMVNFGTKHQEAQEFMDKAFESKGDEASDLIVQDAWEQIKAIATK